MRHAFTRREINIICRALASFKAQSELHSIRLNASGRHGAANEDKSDAMIAGDLWEKLVCIIGKKRSNAATFTLGIAQSNESITGQYTTANDSLVSDLLKAMNYRLMN